MFLGSATLKRKSCQHFVKILVDTPLRHIHNVGMHPIQEKLIELSQKHNIKKMGLRHIGRLIGVEHPQKVKYHLKKLGLLEEEESKIDSSRLKKVVQTPSRKEIGIVSIPILGLANCGDATMLADAKIEGHLPVSNRLFKRTTSHDDLFAVRAVGTSMNKANIDGKRIEDGDYVIIDSSDRLPQDGEYVLSVISGAANIKKFVRDEKNHQILLESESTNYFPPIYLHEDDLSEYLVNGKVAQVIKAPQNDDVRYEPIT